MLKVIHSESIKAALAARGWTQDQLAEAIGESPQVVSNWMQGKNFPRPAKLLKLATSLRLGFDQLVKPDIDQPVIAFRKKAGTRTTEEHVVKATAMGFLLKPLVSHMPGRQALHTTLSVPSTEYSSLQLAVAQVRERLAISAHMVLKYEHLIQEFKLNDAVLIPVLWGEKQNHKNALHILLPSEQVTFVYLNLDTHLEDFKFWMAHELAHVYTPDLAGTNEGEDFADAFAGALLFPQACAEATYAKAAKAGTRASDMLSVLLESASEHSISINTVFLQVQAYAKAKGLALLALDQRQLHSTRNSVRTRLVSEALFQPSPPRPDELIATTGRLFQSHFFVALKQMLIEHGTGPGYVQQVLDIGLQDAAGLHSALVGESGL
jgi:transcriptional regulator with XRE-family HTH domain